MAHKNPKKLTVRDVRAAVEAIRAETSNEEQHGMEDQLWMDVLHAVAAGAANSAELATEALKTIPIPFTRWYA